VASGSRRLGTLSSTVGLTFVFLGGLIGIGAFRDNSFLTHLATGRLILESGIPTEDPYSFTAAGEPWVVQSWLWSLVTAQLEALGGLGLVRVAMGGLSAVLAGIIWLLTAPARSLLVRILLSGLLVLMGASGFWPERPLLLGLVGLGLVLLAAEGRVDPRWLIPVLWIWANAHGSFPLGILVALLLWAGRHLDGGDARTERRVALWTTVGAATAVIGPLGLKVLVFPVELLGRQDVLSGVVEWQPPTFDEMDQRLFLVYVLVCIAGLVRRPSWRAGLPLVVFLGAGLLAVRNDAPAALVFLPGAAACLVDLGGSRVVGDRRSPVLAGASVVLAALAILVLLVPLGQEADQEDRQEQLVAGPHLNLDGYPVAALSWLDGEGLLTPETRLLARDYVGNYLESATDGEIPVFVDDRFDMYPETVLEDQVTLLDGEAGDRGGPLAVLERYEPDLVVWETASATGQQLVVSPDWGVIYQDDTWMVVCPRQEDGELSCTEGWRSRGS